MRATTDARLAGKPVGRVAFVLVRGYNGVGWPPAFPENLRLAGTYILED